MWQELRNEAAAACFEYVQEAGLLGPLPSCESSQRIKTWVPETLRAQAAAYALQWHRAIPVKGIIIGQSPTPYDKCSPSSNETAPHLAASFAFRDGAEPPAASEILANEFRLCGKDGAEAVEAIRDCWKLVDQGVLSVHALPLGMENRFDWSPATESDVLQMQVLAKALCHLISLSAEMRPRGTTRVVAMGRWAHDLASELRKQLTDRLHAGHTKYWTLDIRASLSHPTRTWHKFQTRTPDHITMGREEDLLALYELFNPGPNVHASNGNHANGNHDNGNHGPSPQSAGDGRSRIASYLDSITNGFIKPAAAAVGNGAGARSKIMAAAGGNENADSGLRSGYNGCESPARQAACAGVLNEIQLDSNVNSLDVSSNGHERGMRCALGGGNSVTSWTSSTAQRIVPVFGTAATRNLEQEHTSNNLLFNRDYETRAAS